MRIVSIGGGPAGLYFSILMKKAMPETDITIVERNRADDTFGWGVVFSDETLGNFEREDPESMAKIREEFRYWGEIETHYGGAVVTSTGHGFCGLSRKKLLMILQDRCRELGVKMEFAREVTDFDAVKREADLVLGADGVNSAVRARWAEHFKPSFDWRRCKFCWLGTDKTLRAFTFIFEENEHGLFQVHAYPFEEGRSTWIVECREETWKRAGLDKAGEEETVRYCEQLFAQYLDGHRLLTNRSLWRTFPTIVNERWHHDNVVIVGDAAHTAHFSIGSGTKLAMEDAIALADTFKRLGTRDVPAALAAYQASRYDETRRLQRAAQTSLEWFETSSRYQKQDPVTFSFNLMTRSKRITYDNLALRDPELVRRAAERFAEAAGAPKGTRGKAPPPIFTPFSLRGMRLENRIVVSPMCQYSARGDGVPHEWHLVHLGSRAVGGAALVLTEASAVTPEGRISPADLGIWKDEHVEPLTRIFRFIEKQSAVPGMQLAHAGWKASTAEPWKGGGPVSVAEGGWRPTYSASSFPFTEGWQVPKALDESGIRRITQAFADAAKRVLAAGGKVIELHSAHGYLLHSFLSPIANRRNDAYGGSLENRMRFLLETVEAVRGVWPEKYPLFVRISATDWAERGWTIEDSIELAGKLKGLAVDLIDCSSGGVLAKVAIPAGPGYQVPFAERIRREAGIMTGAVGMITSPEQADTIVRSGQADAVFLARELLRDPYFPLRAAQELRQEIAWPNQYLRAKRSH